MNTWWFFGLYLIGCFALGRTIGAVIGRFILGRVHLHDQRKENKTMKRKAKRAAEETYYAEQKRYLLDTAGIRPELEEQFYQDTRQLAFNVHSLDDNLARYTEVLNKYRGM